MPGKAEANEDASASEAIERIAALEREVDRLKALVSLRFGSLRPTAVSFRGSARLLVSTGELDEGVEDARRAVFRHEL